MYLMLAVCILVFLYTVYLVTRLRMPRIPEQVGQYGPGLGAGIGVLLVNGLLLGLAAWAALEKAWIPWAMFTLLAGIFSGLVSRDVQIVAFSEDWIKIRGLFGAPAAYCWEDVTACTHREERIRTTGGLHVTYNYVMYRLALPGRTLRINSGEEAGRAFLQVLERKRPDLKV